MSKKLNALEILFLHYINGKNKNKVLNYSFWFNQYSTNPNTLLNSLLKKGVIEENADLNKVLNSLKVPDLKDILRKHNLKLSGNKADLIERIIENDNVINFDISNYPEIYVVTKHYRPVLEDTDFINYFHHNYSVDIFDAYDYYLKHPDKPSKEIIIDVLNNTLEERIQEKVYHEAISIYNSLARYYYNLSDEYSAQYHLHNYQMLAILNEIERYKEYSSYGISMSIDENQFMFFINDWALLQYKSLLKTRQITTSDLQRELINSTKHLPFSLKDKEAAAIYIIERVSDNDDASRNLMNKVMKQSNKYQNVNSNNRSYETKKPEKYKLDESIKKGTKQQPTEKNSGCLMFLSVPAAIIVYCIMQFSNFI